MPPVKKPKVKPAKELKKEEVTPVVSGQLKKKVQKQEGRQKLKRGVVCIRHLPHGFFEDQLRGYFEQFGTVTRLRLARSRLTGGTKGYAFVEFEYPEVAEVAAETMDNYLMFNKVVKASYIPPEKQIYNFFKTSVRKVKNKAGKAIYVSGKTTALAKRVKKFNETSDETYQKRTSEKLKKIKKLNQKYAHLGIDFNKIVVGSKIDDENAESEDKTKTKNENLSVKSGKRKTTSTEKLTKKSKKEPALKDLLETTLNEDSDDEDYVATSKKNDEDSEENLSKSIGLEDLLGATLNDDSGDEEWNAVSGVESTDSAEESDEQLSDTEDDEEEEDSPPQKLKAQKNISKLKNSKTDSLEKLIKHKKHTGGIQKVGKTLSKKPKIAKAKNAMHAALTKQLAKPLPLLKNKVKEPKKQKN